MTLIDVADTTYKSGGSNPSGAENLIANSKVTKRNKFS